MANEDLKISQLKAKSAGFRDGKIPVANLKANKTQKVTPQELIGGVKASFDWQSDTTYASGDFVEYIGEVWRSLQSSNTGNVPTENAFWTNEPISTADGITDTQYATGMFTYNDSKVIDSNAQYYLQIAAPFKSTNFATELAAGDWAGPAPIAQNVITFIPQSPDPAHNEGSLFYDEGQKSLSIYNDISGSKLTVGREQWKRGINKTGGALTNGQIVKSGTIDVTSDLPTILLVGANDVDINDTLGFLTHDCADDAECEVTTFGDLHDLDTTTFTEGILYMSTTPGDWSNTAPSLPAATVNMGRFEKIDASTGRIFVRIVTPQSPSENSFSPSFRSLSTGLHYVTGGYLFGASNFTPSGTPQPLGTANIAHGMHAFIVLGAASTDMIVRVTGTKFVDEGAVRTTSATVDIDTSGGSLNDYYETPDKWIGVINYTLLSGTGVTVNYGYSKYWNNKEKPFIISQVSWDGEAGFSDSSPNVSFFHHSSSGWTYNVGSTPTPAAAISDMQADYVTEYQFSNGLKFNYKRIGLSETIDGSANEGLIITVTVNNANSVANSNFDIKYIE